MEIITKTALILVFFGALSGCKPSLWGNKLDIAGDAMVVDLRAEISDLDSILREFEDQKIKLEGFMASEELETKMRLGIKKELFEAEVWKKKLFEVAAYRKIRLKRRLSTLKQRNSTKNDYSLVTKKEISDYFTNKKVNPLKRGWENRFRTALDLNP